MRNFHRLTQGLDVFPLLHSIQTQPTLWDRDNLRTIIEGSPHAQVNDIWLRFNDLKPYLDRENLAGVLDEHESIFYPAWYQLPQAHQMVFDLMARVRGSRLGRVMVTKLSPGKSIAAHEDSGSHASYFERYHIVLQGGPGSIFRCGDESVCMQTGEVWWFENSIEHDVVNNSADDRIHMIVDVAVAI